jgi:ankyrin repeat protein
MADRGMTGMLLNPDGSYMMLFKSGESNEIPANVDEVDAQMHTALHRAAKRGDAEVTSRLLQRKANVNVTDARGITPLHVAACQNQASIVRMLCTAGADVDARHFSGADCIADGALILRKSALHFAAERGHMEVIEALIEHGAWRGIKDDGGRCPNLSAAHSQWRLADRGVRKVRSVGEQSV